MSTTIIFDVQRSLKTAKKRGGKKARPDFEQILHQAVRDEDLESFTPNAYIDDTDAHYSIKWALRKAGWNVKPFPSMKRDLKRFPNAIVVTAGELIVLIMQLITNMVKNNHNYC